MSGSSCSADAGFVLDPTACACEAVRHVRETFVLAHSVPFGRSPLALKKNDKHPCPLCRNALSTHCIQCEHRLRSQVTPTVDLDVAVTDEKSQTDATTVDGDGAVICSLVAGALVVGSCGHCFHAHCFAQHFASDSNPNSCPFCCKPWVFASSSRIINSDETFTDSSSSSSLNSEVSTSKASNVTICVVIATGSDLEVSPLVNSVAVSDSSTMVTVSKPVDSSKHPMYLLDMALCDFTNVKASTCQRPSFAWSFASNAVCFGGTALVPGVSVDKAGSIACKTVNVDTPEARIFVGVCGPLAHPIAMTVMISGCGQDFPLVITTLTTPRQLTALIHDACGLPRETQQLHVLGGSSTHVLPLATWDDPLLKMLGRVDDVKLEVRDALGCGTTFDHFDHNGVLLPSSAAIVHHTNTRLIPIPRGIELQLSLDAEPISDSTKHQLINKSFAVSGWQDVFGISLSWQPHQHRQSVRALSTFLSALYVFVDHLESREALSLRVLGYFRSLGATTPAVMALYLLIQRKMSLLTSAHQSVLVASWFDILHRGVFGSFPNENGMMKLLPTLAMESLDVDMDEPQLLSPSSSTSASSSAVTVEQSDLFELSRHMFAALLQNARIEHAQTEAFEVLDLTSSQNLKAPPQASDAEELRPDLIRHYREIYPNHSEMIVWKGSGVNGGSSACPVSDSTSSLHANSAPDISCSSSSSSSSSSSTSINTLNSVTNCGLSSSVVREWRQLVWRDIVRSVCDTVCMRVVDASTLGQAPKPSLTWDEYGMLSVSTARGKDANSQATLFSPAFGNEHSISVTMLQKAVTKLRADNPTLFTESSVFVDQREPIEGILVCMDVSESMNQPADFLSFDPNDEDDCQDNEQANISAAPDFDDNGRAPDELDDLPLEPRATAQQCASQKGWSDVEKRQFFDTVEWFLQHPNFSDWKSVFGSVFSGEPNDLEQLGQYERNYVDPVHGNMISKYRNVFFSLLRNGKHPLLRPIQERVDELRLKQIERQTLLTAPVAKLAPFKSSALSASESVDSAASASSATSSSKQPITPPIEPLPQFICPITMDVMVDPHTTENGFTYERAAIVKWLKQFASEPLTGVPLRSKNTIPNRALKDQIDAWRLRENAGNECRLRERNARREKHLTDISLGKEVNGMFTNLFVKTLTGQTVTLHAIPHDFTCNELREEVAHKLDIANPMQIRLIFAGKSLSHEMASIKAFGLQNESTLHAVLQPGGDLGGSRRGNRLQHRVAVRIKVQDSMRRSSFLASSSYVVLACDPDERIWSLKYRLWNRLNRAPNTFSLWAGLKATGDGVSHGWPLKDTSTVREYMHIARVLKTDKDDKGVEDDDDDNDDDSYKDTDEEDGASVEVVEDKTELFEFQISGPRLPDEIRHRREQRLQQLLTRLQAAKQFFHAMINRQLAYSFPLQIGLLTFGNKKEVSLKCPLTALYETFRTEMDRIAARGDTSLYDALCAGAQHLQDWKQSGKERFANAKLRIIVLSDGKDTCSDQSAFVAVKQLQRAGIVVDAIQIGRAEQDSQLVALCKATNGFCVAPKTIRAAVRLCELETFLTQCERPDRPPPKALRDSWEFDQMVRRSRPDAFNAANLPTVRQTFDLSSKVASLDSVVNQADSDSSAFSTGPPGTVVNIQHVAASTLKHVFKQLRAIHKDPHPAFTVYPCVDNVCNWNMLLQGPEGSLYAGGVWRVSMHFPPSYPKVAPQVRFVTPILHVNVSASSGRVCHSILDRNWSQDVTVRVVLDCIYGLLLSPQIDDPLDSDLALSFYSASGAYEARVMRHTKRNASRSLEEWLAHFDSSD